MGVKLPARKVSTDRISGAVSAPVSPSVLSPAPEPDPVLVHAADVVGEAARRVVAVPPPPDAYLGRDAHKFADVPDGSTERIPPAVVDALREVAHPVPPLPAPRQAVQALSPVSSQSAVRPLPAFTPAPLFGRSVSSAPVLHAPVPPREDRHVLTGDFPRSAPPLVRLTPVPVYPVADQDLPPPPPAPVVPAPVEPLPAAKRDQPVINGTPQTYAELDAWMRGNATRERDIQAREGESEAHDAFEVRAFSEARKRAVRWLVAAGILTGLADYAIYKHEEHALAEASPDDAPATPASDGVAKEALSAPSAVTAGSVPSTPPVVPPKTSKKRPAHKTKNKSQAPRDDDSPRVTLPTGGVKMRGGLEPISTGSTSFRREGSNPTVRIEGVDRKEKKLRVRPDLDD